MGILTAISASRKLLRSPTLELELLIRKYAFHVLFCHWAKLCYFHPPPLSEPSLYWASPGFKACLGIRLKTCLGIRCKRKHFGFLSVIGVGFDSGPICNIAHVCCGILDQPCWLSTLINKAEAPRDRSWGETNLLTSSPPRPSRSQPTAPPPWPLAASWACTRALRERPRRRQRRRRWRGHCGRARLGPRLAR